MNQRHGQGACQYSSGAAYEGAWAQDLWHGVGCLKEKAGDVYEGAFDGGRKAGHGSTKFRSGNAHTGEYAEGVMEGYGCLTLANGDCYVGNFRSGVKHGEVCWPPGPLGGRKSPVFGGRREPRCRESASAGCCLSVGVQPPVHEACVAFGWFRLASDWSANHRPCIANRFSALCDRLTLSALYRVYAPRLVSASQRLGRHCLARQGTAGHGRARQGRTAQGRAGQGKGLCIGCSFVQTDGNETSCLAADPQRLSHIRPHLPMYWHPRGAPRPPSNAVGSVPGGPGRPMSCTPHHVASRLIPRRRLLLWAVGTQAPAPPVPSPPPLSSHGPLLCSPYAFRAVPPS